MKKNVRRAAVAALVTLLAPACGGAEAENAPPESPAAMRVHRSTYPSAPPAQVFPSTPSPAVTRLRLYVVSAVRIPMAASVAARLQAALVAAGYNVVTSEAAPHDLTVRVAVTAAEEPSYLQTTNGRRQVKLKVHVALTMIGRAGVVDGVTHEFESMNGEVGEGSVMPLVARLNGSGRLAHYAAEQANARKAIAEVDQSAAEQAEAQKQAAAGQAVQGQTREQEEGVWVHARPLGCKMPARLDACDAVQMYVAKYPSGIHVDEATKVLDEASPKLQELQKDENSWVGSGADACRAHTGRDACVGVELYVTKYPAGLHADEARSLLAK